MKKHIIIAVLLFTKYLWGQDNLIPNPEFNLNQPGSSPRCETYSSTEPEELGLDIQNWVNGQSNSGQYTYSDPYWMDNNCSFTAPSPFYCPSNFFMGIETPPGDNGDYTDAVRTSLISYMNTNSDYLFRITYLATKPWTNVTQLQTGDTRIRVWFTKLGPHWYSTWGNVTLSIIMYPPFGPNWVQQWVILPVAIDPEFKSIVGELGNIVITGENGATQIAYVELAATCQNPLVIQNHTFYTGENEQLYASGGSLLAGYSVNGAAPYGNVIVQNGGVETFEANSAIYLEPGFEAQAGSTFEAYINPCNPLDPPQAYADTASITIHDDSHDTINCTDTVKIIGLDGDTVSYSNYWWSFGNGITSTQKYVKIFYGQPGTYLIKLAITDKYEFTDTLTKYYIVLPCNYGEHKPISKSKNRDNIVSSDSTINNGEIQLYPNPGNGIFNIVTKNGVTINRIEIHDVLGKLCYEQNSPKTSSINISTYSAGMYFVKITSGANIYNNKLVLIK